MINRAFAESAARNAGPILEILQEEFRQTTSVLEIGSGTGQHAVRFAAAMPQLCWQTSDREENHAAINAWISESDLENIRRPLLLDVRSAALESNAYDAVYSSNTAHIMSFDAVKRMFELVGRALNESGLFCLYGPFLINGEFTTPSNRQFDAGLKSRDPSMGIRDLTALDDFGAMHGLRRSALYALPANNMLAVWRKNAAGPA